MAGSGRARAVLGDAHVEPAPTLGAAGGGVRKLGRGRTGCPCAGLSRRGARDSGVVGCPPSERRFFFPPLMHLT